MLALAEKRLDRTGQTKPLSALTQKLGDEAAIEELPTELRSRLYFDALGDGIPSATPPRLDAFSAAELGLREGVPGIAQAVQERMRRDPMFKSEPIDLELTIRLAMDSADPLAEFLLLIQCAVALDVRGQLGSQAEPMDRCPLGHNVGLTLALGRRALEEIRRLDPDGAERDLSKVLRLYDPVNSLRKSEYERKRAAVEEAKRRGEHPPFFDEDPPGLIPTSFAACVAATVDDLGPQGGGEALTTRAILWNGVASAESRLFAQGKLRREEQVTEVGNARPR